MKFLLRTTALFARITLYLSLDVKLADFLDKPNTKSLCQLSSSWLLCYQKILLWFVMCILRASIV